MQRFFTLVVFALALTLRPAQAQSEDHWRAQVEPLLKQAAKNLTTSGYAQTRETQIGSLPDNENDSFTLTLHAGTKYALVGVCDSDCRDLDLVLYDVGGNQVDSDTQNDDVPILQVAPKETQRYRVKVIMWRCWANPCWYGIGVYGK